MRPPLTRLRRSGSTEEAEKTPHTQSGPLPIIIIVIIIIVTIIIVIIISIVIIVIVIIRGSRV